MIDLYYCLLSFHQKCFSKTNPKNIVSRIIYWIIVRLMNWAIFIWYKGLLFAGLAKSQCLNNTGGKHLITVSLTSFPVRIGAVWLVVESIFRQKMAPNRVILWLSKEQFPSISGLPACLLRQQERGLEIKLVDGDIRSHKKYAYSLGGDQDDIIITVDDDVVYPSNMISSLISAHEKYPDCVCARYGRHITYDVCGNLNGYQLWPLASEYENPSFDNFFAGVGGTLFTRGMMDDDIERIDLAVSLCPIADDIFLNAMARLKKTKILFVKSSIVYAPIQIKNNVTLYETNSSENDNQIRAIRDYYLASRNIRVF